MAEKLLCFKAHRTSAVDFIFDDSAVALYGNNRTFTSGVFGSKMKQMRFMGVVCTVMLFVIYRTTNYQQQQTEMQSKLLPFSTSKDGGGRGTASQQPKFSGGSFYTDFKKKERELQSKEAEMKRREQEVRRKEEAAARAGIVLEDIGLHFSQPFIMTSRMKYLFICKRCNMLHSLPCWIFYFIGFGLFFLESVLSMLSLYLIHCELV